MKNNIHYFHRKESLDSNRPVVINEPYSKEFNFEKNEKTNLI